MKYIEFDNSKPIDFIPIGRIAIDFNPTDMYMPLSESSNFNKYVGGSPANIAVGLARLGCRVGFIGCVSDDQFGDFVTNYFDKEGIDTSHITRAKNGEKLGLTFTEILSKEKSSILMYRDQVADFCLDPADVDEQYIASAKAIVISGTALAQSPSREACLKAVMLAKKNNVRIIFDIDYREYTWKSMDEIAVYYSLVAQNADIIMGSREEFDLTEGIVGVKDSDPDSAKYWQSFGASICVIKHGKEDQQPIPTMENFIQLNRFLQLNLRASAEEMDMALHSFTAFFRERKLLIALNSALLLHPFLFLLTAARMQCRLPLRLNNLSRKAKKSTAKWLPVRKSIKLALCQKQRAFPFTNHQHPERVLHIRR